MNLFMKIVTVKKTDFKNIVVLNMVLLNVILSSDLKDIYSYEQSIVRPKVSLITLTLII